MKVLDRVTGVRGQQEAANRAAQAQAEGVENAQAIQQSNIETVSPLLQDNYNSSLATIRDSSNAQQGAVNTGYNQAINTARDSEGNFTPLVSNGIDANNLQAAMSGALGPVAQQEAIANFQDSPANDFLASESRKLIESGAAASNNLVSGNTLTALQDRGYQLANTSYNDRFNQLGSVSNQGSAAAGMLAQLRDSIANMQIGRGQSLQGILSNVATQEAQTQQGLGTALANLYTGNANQQAQLAQSLGTAQGSGHAFAAAQPSSFMQLANLSANIYKGTQGG